MKVLSLRGTQNRGIPPPPRLGRALPPLQRRAFSFCGILRKSVMLKSQLPALVESVVSDFISFLGIPGGSTAGRALAHYHQRRNEAARGILLSELAKGNIAEYQAASEDDAIAIIVKYLRAAQFGAARLNLRLLAKLLAGQASTGKPLYADDFDRFSDSLASLTREEIILLVYLHQHGIQPALKPDKEGRSQPRALDRLGRDYPGMFPSQEYYAAICAKVQRTGLVSAMSGYGSLVYEASPLMDELVALVDFRDALQEEPDPAL